MIVKNKIIADFDGVPMRTPDGKTIWTVALVLLNACVQPGDPNKPPRVEKDHKERYELGQRLHALRDGEEIDISPEMVAKLKEDICRLYGTMVAHPMMAILEGKALH